jgi:hypothetical protein
MVTEAWNSAVFDTRRNRLVIWGGGHGDYAGNELYALDVASSSIVRLTNPGLPLAASDCGEAIASGTQPNSRHTYDAIAYMENVDRMFAFGGSLTPCGYLGNGTWTFNFTTSIWERRSPSGAIPNAVPGVVSAYDSATGKVFLHDNHYLYSYNFGTDSYQRLSGDNAIDYHMTAAIDAANKKFVIVGNGNVYVYDISAGSNYTRRTLTRPGSEIVNSFYPGLAPSPSRENRRLERGDSVYSLDSNTGAWTMTTLLEGGPALKRQQTMDLLLSNAFFVVN